MKQKKTNEDCGELVTENCDMSNLFSIEKKSGYAAPPIQDQS